MISWREMTLEVHKVLKLTFLEFHDLDLFREYVHELLNLKALSHRRNLHCIHQVHLHYLGTIAMKQSNSVFSVHACH
jgi:hypothetical protein